MEMHAAILRESLAPTDSDAPPICASPAERSGLDAAGDDSSVAHAHPLLEVRALTVSRGGGRQPWEASLTLRKGEAVNISAECAAARTRRLRAICGLERPLRGEVFWKGVSLRSASRLLHAELAYLGHRSGIKAALTPRENLRFHLRLRDCCPRIDIETSVAMVGLEDMIDKPCWRLTAFQRRSVEYARLLMTRATIWMLEEPLLALDAGQVSTVEGFIADHLRDRGVAVIASDRPMQSICGRVRQIRFGAASV